MERRLASILAADVVGYSRQMAADEEGTFRRLQALRETFLQPLIARHNGRIVKLMGDGLLIEFASAVESAACALEWQDALTGNWDGDEPCAFQFRIGINLGDIIAQDGDIHGDGVNVAARLEGVAEPGGICISEEVFRNVQGRLQAGFEAMGPQQLRNVDRPVIAYRMMAAGAGPERGAEAARVPDIERASVAVLPFVSFSDDPEDRFFGDGMTEDIITGLSRFRTLYVIGRNSAFAFKGRNIGSKEIGRRLGVQYLVEGSVRRAGQRVRVTVQLSEAETGTQLWAERFDRLLEDILAVQDEIAGSIVAVLPGRVQQDVAQRAARKPMEAVKAYELMLQAKAMRDGLGAEDTARARVLCRRALDLDPQLARAYMYLADTYVVDAWLGLGDPDDMHFALDYARKGAALDNRDVYLQDQLGYAYLCARQWDEADAQFERTLGRIVSEAESMAWCGYGFLLLGRRDRAREVIERAVQLDPFHPPALDWILGQLHFMRGDYDAVLRVMNGEALLNSLARAFLVAAYAHLGRMEDAGDALRAFVVQRHAELRSRGLTADHDSVGALAGAYRDMWRRPGDWRRLESGLMKAGLPE